MASRSAFSIYEPQIRVPVAEIPAVSYAGDLGAAFGTAADSLIEATEEKFRESGKRWSADAVTGLNAKHSKRLDDVPDDEVGEGFAAGIAEDFDRDVYELEKDMPAYARPSFKSGVEVARRRILAFAKQREEEARRRAGGKAADNALDNLGKAASYGIADAGTLIAEGKAISRALGQPPEKAIEAHTNIGTSYIRGEALRNPAKTIAILDEKGKEFIPNARRRAMVRRNVEAERRRSEGRDAGGKGLAVLRDLFDAQSVVQDVRNGTKSHLELIDPDELGSKIGRGNARELRKQIDEVHALAGEEAHDLDQVVEQIVRGEPHDPKDKDHRRRVDLFWERHAAPFVEGLSDEERRRFEAEFVKRTGIFPHALAGALRSDLKSAQPAQIAGAVELLEHVDRRSPHIADAFDAGDRRLIESVIAQTNSGVDREAAVNAHVEARDLTPEKRGKLENEFAELYDAGDLEHLVRQAVGTGEKRKLQLRDIETLPYDPLKPAHARTLPYNEEDDPVTAQPVAFPFLVGVAVRERANKAIKGAAFSIAADFAVTILANRRKPEAERHWPTLESILVSGLSGAATGVADFGTDQWKYEAGVAFVGSLAEDTLGGHPPRWIAALGAGAGAGLWEKWGKEKLKRWFGENPLSQASGKFVSKVIKEVFGAEAELAEHEVAEFLKGFMRAIEKAEEALDYWEQQFNDWFWMDDRDPIH